MLVLFALLATSPVRADEATVCESYPRLQAELGCAPEGYLSATGYRVCREFVAIDGEFTPEGRAVMAKIRRCLAGFLENDRTEITCENVEAKAFASHVPCYVDAGFCRMPESDKLITYSHLWKVAFRPGAWDQFRKLQRACATN
jgi:hypothetical protein